MARVFFVAFPGASPAAGKRGCYCSIPRVRLLVIFVYPPWTRVGEY